MKKTILILMLVISSILANEKNDLETIKNHLGACFNRDMMGQLTLLNVIMYPKDTQHLIDVNNYLMTNCPNEADIIGSILLKYPDDNMKGYFFQEIYFQIATNMSKEFSKNAKEFKNTANKMKKKAKK